MGWSGVSVAAEYRPDQFLGLDLSGAVLSPKRLGPTAEFEPVPVQARDDRESENRQAPEPTSEPRLHIQSPRIADLPVRGAAGARREAAPARREAARRGAHETRPSPWQSARCPGVRCAGSGVALQVGRHLQLEALGEARLLPGAGSAQPWIGMTPNKAPGTIDSTTSPPTTPVTIAKSSLASSHRRNTLTIVSHTRS